jgi:hypothetical protein
VLGEELLQVREEVEVRDFALSALGHCVRILSLESVLSSRNLNHQREWRVGKNEGALRPQTPSSRQGLYHRFGIRRIYRFGEPAFGRASSHGGHGNRASPTPFGVEVYHAC